MTHRILIVDDNPINLRLAADVLEDAGFAIERAADAEEALTLLDTSRPDLILMDLALPGMDGLTLTRKLKADERFKSIPIVALTASAMKGDEVRVREAGCEGYITKPIDTRAFALQVGRFLSAADAPVEARITTILIVDDQPMNRRVLRAGLEAEGYEVLEAENGARALEILDAGHVDAVISDILMPTMDGFRLCHEIRKSARPYAGLPFVLYTATYDSPSDRELAETIGADGYILKPSPIPAILQVLFSTKPRPEGSLRLPGAGVAESYVLERYNAALIHKLEHRNSQLQQSLSQLSAAHEQILELNQSLEDKVRQRTAELDTAIKQLEAFSFSVAHDLRGPLRQVSGYVSVLQESAGPALGPDSGECIRRIVDATRRMDHLIIDLLAFARSSRADMQPVEVELDALLDEAIEAIRPDTAGRNVEWRREPLPRVLGDQALLRQVFINLLSNAAKYSRMRDPAIIEIGSRDGGTGEVVVHVRDNGVGFDMQHANRLFGAFQRLHSSGSFEGSGIGLANVQRIVLRHGGSVWAEAAVDRGATFYVSLPAAEGGGGRPS